MSMLATAPTGSDLKSWALGVAQHAEVKRAKLRCAGPLVVVLHRMLSDDTSFIAHAPVRAAAGEWTPAASTHPS
jgi:hypothetical protein